MAVPSCGSRLRVFFAGVCVQACVARARFDFFNGQGLVGDLPGRGVRPLCGGEDGHGSLWVQSHWKS